MNRFAALLAAGLLAPAAAAQTKEIQDKVNKDLDTVRKAERTEDVEVLRRILNRAFHLPDKATAPLGAYFNPLDNRQFQGGTTGFNPNANFFPQNQLGGTGIHPNSPYQALTSGSSTVLTAAPQIGPFDGVYLPGHGAVYTLRVPESVKVHLDPVSKAAGLAETCAKCHGDAPQETAPAPSAAKPATEWDRTVGELRGQKPADEPKPAATAAVVCDPGRLTERVVGKLWGNVKHVRHLPAAERVTVVVTFDGYAGPADRPGWKVRYFYEPVTAPDGKSTRYEKRSYLVPADAPDAPAPVVPTSLPAEPPAEAALAPKAPVVRSGFTPDEANQLTLGDLHLKQGKAKEAAEAYQRGLSRYRKPTLRTTTPPDLTPAQAWELVAELEKGVRDAYRRLAQAWLAAGESDKAAAALDLARTFTVQADRFDKREGVVAVPAKLILSVTRADALKTEDDLTAFRKLVTVETVGFPPPAKAKQ